nr:hypothetical protein [Burkholderia sp. BCC0398]
MSVPILEYRGYELRAYSQQVFPPYWDPYASGSKSFSSVVRIDSIPSGRIVPRRFRTISEEAPPDTAMDALILAMNYGRLIVDLALESVPSPCLFRADTGSGSWR